MEQFGGGEQLRGGAIDRDIARVGHIVRRPRGPWTPAVHKLLRYLLAHGLHVPAPLVTDHDHELLGYIDGVALWQPGNTAYVDDVGLVSVAELLRQFHEAVEGFELDGSGPWQELPLSAPQPHQLVCHNDFAPWNILRTAGGLALIDWDLAAPGTRLWDVAYATWTCVPLWRDDDIAARGLEPIGDRRDRLRGFVDAYGLDRHGRASLLAMVERRQLAALAQVELWAAEGRPGWQGQWSLPEPWRHGNGYRREIEHLHLNWDTWTAALT